MGQCSKHFYYLNIRLKQNKPILLGIVDVADTSTFCVLKT